MATLPRSAKSSSDWTRNELLAYNITVSSQSPEAFYLQPLPELASLATDSGFDPNLLSGTLSTQGLSRETHRLLEYLDMASRPNSNQESAVHDFAKEILRALGYELRGSLLRSHYVIPLLISGDQTRSAQTSVCLVQGRSGIILIPMVHEDKTTVDPEPQVIASAIATFQYNNRIRARFGKQELDSMSIPCITMSGTRPTFYVVPVTRELSEAVHTGRYPASTTVVKKCVVVSNSGRLSEGMESPDFRQVAIQHYVSFDPFAIIHWDNVKVPAGAMI